MAPAWTDTAPKAFSGPRQRTQYQGGRDLSNPAAAAAAAVRKVGAGMSELAATVLHAGNVHVHAELNALRALCDDHSDETELINEWLKVTHPEILELAGPEFSEPYPVLIELLRHRRATAVQGTRCRVCGCTNERACPGGCHWVEEDLCSECAPAAHSIIRP